MESNTAHRNVPDLAEPIHLAFAPATSESVRNRAREHRIPLDEARRRFLQVATLRSVLADPMLADRLVLGGAAALRLFHEAPRRSIDLDFTTRTCPEVGADGESIRRDLTAAIGTIVEARFRDEARGVSPADPPGSDAVRIDLFLARCSLPVRDGRVGDNKPLHVWLPTPEVLLAKKLLTIVNTLLYPWRDRGRDLWDAWWLRRNLSVDLAIVGDLMRKKQAVDGWDRIHAGRWNRRIQQPLRLAWPGSLSHSLWQAPPPPFEEVWDSAADSIDLANFA